MKAATAQSTFSIPLYRFVCPATAAIPHQLESFRRFDENYHTLSQPYLGHFFGWLLIMNNDIFLFSFPLKLYSETSNKRSFCNWFGVGPKKLFIYFKILSDK